MIHELRQHRGKSVDQLIEELEVKNKGRYAREKSIEDFKKSMIGKYLKITFNPTSVSFCKVVKENLIAECVNILSESYNTDRRVLNIFWFDIPEIKQKSRNVLVTECTEEEYNEVLNIKNLFTKYLK